MSKKSLSVIPHRLTAGQWTEIDNAVESLDSTVFHVINDHPLAVAKAKQWPGRMIISRVIPKGMHNDDNIYQVMKPAEVVHFLETIADSGYPDNLWFSMLNEPIPAESDELIAWIEAFVQLIVDTDLRVVIGNFAVGTPDYSAYDDYDYLLDFMVNHSDQLILGVHEYFPLYANVGRPHLLGRVTERWYAHRKSKDKPMPLTILTEYGMDVITETTPVEWRGKPIRRAVEIMDANGFSSPNRAAAAQYHDGFALYDDFDWVLGVCIFIVGSYSNSAEGWWDHDILSVPNFLSHLIDMHHSEPGRDDDEDTVILPPMGVYTQLTLPANIRLNFRVVPGGEIIGKLKDGDFVYLSSQKPVHVSGYNWYAAVNSSGVEGYFADVDALSTNPPIGNKVVDLNWVSGKLDEMSDLLQEIKRMIR